MTFFESHARARSRTVRPTLALLACAFVWSVLCTLTLAALLASCASIQPPPGGPEDKTPATLDSTSTPQNRAVNVPRDVRLNFRFDRPVDRSSLQQAFSITPYVIGNPIFKWSGNDEVTVSFPNPLRDSTTYSVQISRDLKTKRGTALPEPIRIIFSTGPAIDTGVLSGFLLVPFAGASPRAGDIYIFAYDLGAHRADTLDVTRTPPDLLTQPTDQGVWQFYAMKRGHTYRVFAVGDVYRNKVYDPGIDSYGIPAGDAVMDSLVKTNFYIRMSLAIDTLRPQLQDVEVVDSLHVRARFSEGIDSNSVRAEYFTLTGHQVIAAYRESPEKRAGQITLLVSPALTPEASLTLSVLRDSVRDLSRNPTSDSADRITFQVPTETRALVAPRFVGIGVTDSVGGISPMVRIPIVFSDAVDRAKLEAGVTLTDTSGHAVPIRFRWLDDARVTIGAVDSLRGNLLHTIVLQTSAIQSPAPLMPRNTRDTVLRYRFITTRQTDNGTLSGNVIVADSFFRQNPQGVIVVQLISMAAGDIHRTVLPHDSTHFSFLVPGGGYRIRAYFSRSGSPTYDPGSPAPWRFGDPTGDFPGGEVEVRPRWEIGRVNFEVR